MRIRRLDLTRYGKFTNHALDFGPVRPGQPDLHILYGPNEAGKSTTLSAWLDLLFGIEAQTRYSFLHPGPTMRVGAVLEIGGKAVTVARIKTRANSLLDGVNVPIPEAVLQGGLGGLGRNAYCAMFSLDDETLVEGGESILASQGDLGELLFSSSAGLTGLSKRLKALQADAEGFIKTARTGRLFDLKKQLEALEAARKAIDVQAPEYARRAEAVRAADLAWTKANADLAAAHSRLSGLERVDGGLPLAQRLARLEEKALAAGDLPVPPPGWAAELADLMAAKTGAGARAEILRATIARLTKRLTELPEDRAVLDLAGQIAEADALRSAHDEAVKDLPSRTGALQDQEAAITALMVRSNLPGQSPKDALLPTAVVSGLRALLATQSGLTMALATAQKEAKDAAAQLAEAEGLLADAGGDAAGASIDSLAALLAEIRKRDPAQALRQAKAQIVAAQATVAERFAALHPWTGTPEALATQTLPTGSQIDLWSQNAEAARRAVVDAGAEVRRLTVERDQRQADLLTRIACGAVTPDDLAAARSERERLWALHRAQLDTQTAALFEAAMRRDDLLVAERAALDADAAVQAQSRATLATLGARLAEAEQVARRAQAAATDLAGNWAELLNGISLALPVAWGVVDLRAWLDLRRQAVKAVDDHARSAAAERLAAEDVAQATADLQVALLAQGQSTPPATHDAVLAKASALVATAAKLVSLEDAAKVQRRTVARRQAAHVAAQVALRTWQTKWTALGQGTWLQSETPDPAAVSQQLALIEELRTAIAAQAGLADRVDKMTSNRAAFRSAMAALARQLEIEGSDTVTLWQSIAHRLRVAEDARKVADQHNADLRDASGALAVQDDILRLKGQRLAVMEQHLGVEGAEAVAQILAAAAERAKWQAEIAELQETLVQTTRSATLPDALAMIAAVAAQDLPTELSSARAAAEAAQTLAQTRFADLSRAQADLDAIGGDDAAARLEESRQTLLLQIEEDAQRHLRHRFGIIAVEQALRSYRDSHRSAMMARASAAFQTISRGAYTGLAAQPDRDREILVALGADGTSKLAQDLSKGTRFQLYLALRAAGYHVLADARPPVPFIADDIMETFDDDRSAEAFTLLGEMAMVGQVIYLTHHQHLCEIAKQVCPGAVIRAL